MAKKNYIGWVVSRLYGGNRELILKTLTQRRSDSIGEYFEGYEKNRTWRQDRNDPKVQARVHKVTEIKTIG